MNTHYKKILIALALGFAGGCGFLFVIFYWQAEHTAIATVDAEEMIYDQQAARGVQDFFATWTSSLTSLGKMDDVIHIDPAGQRTLKLFYEANQERILTITRLDEHGVMVSDVPFNSSMGINISGQKHIRELLRSHQPVISDVFKSAEGLDAIALHVPVFQESEFKGSLGILINFKAFTQNIFEEANPDTTYHVWVLSRDGTILHSPEPRFLGKSVSEAIKGSPSLQAMLNDMLKGHKGATTYLSEFGAPNAGLARKYAVYMPIQIGNTFWSIAAATDEQRVLSGLHTLRNELASIIGLMFICGMVFSTLGAKAWLIVKEQKQRDLAEEKLRESENRFRVLAETAPVLIWMSGTDKLCNFFNQVWLDFTGRRLEQELGDGWAEGVHPDDLPGCLKGYTESFDARRPFTLEYRLRRHDGEFRWVSDHGVPRYDSSHKFLGYIGCCVDLTERQQAEEKFRLTVEASPNGIILVNDQGRVVLVNAATEKLYGYSRGELIGQQVEMLMPERFRAAHTGQRKAYAAAPTARAMGAGRELFGRRKDGTEFPVEIGLNPIHSEEGLLVLAVVVDITIRKQTEGELFKQRAELYHMARLSTMNLLTSSLTHELNQPMSAILNNAQAATRFLAAKPPDLAEVKAALEDIVQDAKRAGGVIRQMRDLVRKEQPKLKPLELNRVIADVRRLLHSDLLLRKIELALELDPASGWVNGNAVQLQQVVLNLVLNASEAMEHTPENQRAVVLRTRQQDGSLRVEVSDSGTGISPERMETLFEPFRSSKKEGLGLGLSICRSIVEAHHGRIWAENNVGPGTTVYFILPVDTVERYQD